MELFGIGKEIVSGPIRGHEKKRGDERKSEKFAICPWFPSEAKSENEMVKVSGMKSSLDWPSRKTVGRKTTMVVMVDTKIGMATSRAASSTALRRGLPGMSR